MKNSFVKRSLFCVSLLAATACGSETTTSSTDPTTNSRNPTVAEGTTTDEETITAAEARTAPAMLNGSTVTGKDFLVEAAQGGHNEIGLSQLALEKGVTGATRSFANEMIADHTKAGNELKAVAQQKNVALPDQMDPEHQSLRDAMQKMSGQQLEQAYMYQMLKDHRQTVNLLQGEIEAGTDSDVKAWAQKTLPVVQQHLQMAQRQTP